MKRMLVALSLIGVLSLWAENDYPTVTLTQTVGKVKNGKADSSGAYSKTWEGQAPYWPDEVPPGPCTNYVIKSNIIMRVPATSDEGEYPFPGETLTVQSKATIAYTSCREPALISFKKVTFEDGAYFGNWTSGGYYTKSGLTYELNSLFSAPVTIKGTATIKTDQNTACGTKWTGSVTGASGTVLLIQGPTKGDTSHSVVKESDRHHVLMESDMSGFLGTIQIDTNVVFSMGASPCAVTVKAGGVLERLPGNEAPAMSVSALTLQPGARLSLRLDSETGAHLPVTVTDSLTVAGPVEVTFRDRPPKTHKEKGIEPPTHYKVLTFPASVNVDETSFVYRGILSGQNTHNVITDTFMPPSVELHVDLDDGGQTKSLYVLVRPRVDLLVSQSGANYWNTNPADWSDGQTPHEDADYYAIGKSMRGENKATRYPMHSMTVDSTEQKSLGAIQFRSAEITEFPNEGLFLNWGTLYNYCGGGSLKSVHTCKVVGTVTVGSTSSKPSYLDPANNAFAGFRFLTSFAGGTDAAVVLKGSYSSTPDHRSFAQYEFPSNTTDYCGSFTVRTNAVLAIGKDGFPDARATVEGGTLANAAGSIAALSPANDCTIGELTFQDLGAIECRVDLNTGDIGTVKVLKRLTLPESGMVQVYFSAFPKQSNRAAYEGGFPVLTLAADAEGELTADAFVCAGIIDTSVGAKRIEGSFKVETDASSGERTLWFVPDTKGLMILFR